MSGIPMLEGWADQLRQPLHDLGSGIASIADPKLQIQQALLKHIAENPEAGQQLIDMESANPGSIDKMFGKQVAYLGLGAPSAGQVQKTYERDNATRSVPDVAAENTLQSNRALTDYSATAKPNLERAQSEATITGEDARVAPVQADVKVAEANANLKFNLGETLAKLKGMQAGEGIKDQELVNNALTHFGNIQDLVKAMKNGDPSISAETGKALFNNKGINDAYNQARNDDREDLMNKRYDLMSKMDDARMKHMDNQDAARIANEKASLDDQIGKHDAQTRADIINKRGGQVNALDLFHAEKLGLGSVLDKYVGMNPQQLQQALAPDPKTGQPADPQLAQIMQGSPTMLQSWKSYKDGIGQIQNEDLNKQREDFQKELGRVNTEVISKSGKKTDPSIVQEQTNSLMQHPYVQLMKEKGTPVNIATDQKTGFLGLNPTTELKAGGSISNPKAALADEWHNKHPEMSTAEIKARVEAGVKP